jgi:hypothetical protein
MYNKRFKNPFHGEYGFMTGRDPLWCSAIVQFTTYGRLLPGMTNS